MRRVDHLLALVGLQRIRKPSGNTNPTIYNFNSMPGVNEVISASIRASQNYTGRP